MTRSLRYTFVAIGLALFAAFFAACSGGDDSPSPTPPLIKGHAVVEITSQTPVTLDMLTALATVIKDRMDAAGEGLNFTQGSDPNLRIDFDGQHSINFVTDLLISPGVRFKVPQLEGELIKCKDTSGNEFSIAKNLVQPAGNLPACVSAEGRHGEIEWAPAIGQLNGSPVELTGSMIPKDKALLLLSTGGNPVLTATFDDDGKLVLQDVSKGIIGYPLGVFLGDSLLVAGVIQREITNGSITLAGASQDVLEELRDIIRGGELTSPVNLVSIEKK